MGFWLKVFKNSTAICFSDWNSDRKSLGIPLSFTFPTGILIESLLRIQQSFDFQMGILVFSATWWKFWVIWTLNKRTKLKTFAWGVVWGSVQIWLAKNYHTNVFLQVDFARIWTEKPEKKKRNRRWEKEIKCHKFRGQSGFLFSKKKEN